MSELDERIKSSRGKRHIVGCINDGNNRLAAVLLELDDGFYVCQTRGPNAMIDDGPYDSLEMAVAMARMMTGYDVILDNHSLIGFQVSDPEHLVIHTAAYTQLTHDYTIQLMNQIKELDKCL